MGDDSKNKPLPGGVAFGPPGDARPYRTEGVIKDGQWCLVAFEVATRLREDWYGCWHRPGAEEKSDG